MLTTSVTPLILHVAAFCAAFGLTVFLIPRIIKLATERQWLDIPDDRRVHKTPIPRLGGVAIVVATTLFGAGTTLVVSALGLLPAAASTLWPAIGIGTFVVFFTGLLDDLQGITPRGKLIAQTAAALIVVSQGFVIESLALTPEGSALPLGWFGPALTVLWIVGMTNAFNLIDGIDGLAGTIALIAIVTAIGVDLYVHEPRALFVLVALLGAVFGFLRFNNSPARIFLGDSGSMTLGFFLSIRLLMSSTAPTGQLYFLIPLCALAFPLLDTVIAIARRWLRGDPFSRADGRHIHHQLLAVGLNARRTVELLGAFFAGLAVLGVSVTMAPPQFTFALMLGLGTLGFVSVFYGARWLRYGEFAELGKSIASVVRNARSVVREKIRANDIAQRIRGAGTIEEVHAALADLVDEVRVLDVELVAGDVHLHGPERQQISPADQLPMRLDYPFAWETDRGIQEIILRLWSTRPTEGGHAASARVATRVGPALEEWFKVHARESVQLFGAEPPVREQRTTPRMLRRPEL